MYYVIVQYFARYVILCGRKHKRSEPPGSFVGGQILEDSFEVMLEGGGGGAAFVGGYSSSIQRRNFFRKQERAPEAKHPKV